MDAPIHRLLNALEPGTYLPPHRHTDKEETYLVLHGGKKYQLGVNAAIA